MEIAHPVILLVGKTGAGKSTLGNLLLEKPYDNGPFYVSADMESVTKECRAEMISINGVMHNIVDTPGIFDTQQDTDAVLKKIANYVHKCAHGVKAILIVFEARRFTDEQKNVLSGIRMFLGKDATNHIISVFSHATRAQISDKDEMQRAWNQPVRSFIQNIGNRWSISPNVDYFSPDDPIHKARLKEIKELISGLQGVYTTEQLEKNLREQEKARRQKEEEERRKKQEYEEKLKENARREAEEINRRHMELRRQEQMARQQETEERHRRAMELMRQEQKEAEERHRRAMQQEQKEAEERHRRAMQQEQKEAEERHRRAMQQQQKEAEERRRRAIQQQQEQEKYKYEKRLEGATNNSGPSMALACPAKGCGNQTVMKWGHAMCGGSVTISDCAQIKCNRCGTTDHVRNWVFVCNYHRGDYRYASSTSCGLALSVATAAGRIDPSLSIAIFSYITRNPWEY